MSFSTNNPEQSSTTDAAPRPFVLHTRVVTGTGGGPEKTILNSPRFLQTWGIDSACLFMKPAGDAGFETLQEKAACARADIIGVDDHGPFDISVIRRCLQVCRERNVTIWHAHDYKSNALGLLLRRFHPMHLVTTAHGWVRFTSRTPLYYRIDRFCMKRYDRVICVSQDLVDRCLQSGMNSDRISLIDNAIVAGDYDPSPPSAKDRSCFGFNDQHIVLAAAGRLSEEKGFDLLIRAVRKLTEEGLPIRLIIAGDGHLRDALQNQIDSNGLSDVVRLAGFVSDPREVYRAADVFVLSSLREGLPNVVLEAMASQRAVVATKVNGIPRLVRHGLNGLVVDTSSVDALYHGLKRCVMDTVTRQRLAAAGRRTVESEFSFEQRIRHVVDVYRTLGGDLSLQLRQRNRANLSETSSASDNTYAAAISGH